MATSIAQKIRKCVELIAKRAGSYGSDANITPNLDYPLVDVSSAAALEALLTDLQTREYLTYRASSGRLICSLTLTGWEYFEQLNTAANYAVPMREAPAHIPPSGAIVMNRIFLCHATEDNPQVRAVYQRLKAEGFEPWLDAEDLLPGQLWDQEIRRALQNSDFILIFFSQNSVAKRGYVQREMTLALDTWEEGPDGQIHTIPIRLDACQILERFSKFQWGDLFRDNSWDRLIEAIRFGLEQRQQSVPEVSSKQSKASLPDTAVKRENRGARPLALAMSAFPQERRDNLTPEQRRFLSHLYFEQYQTVEQLADHTGYSIEDVKRIAKELSPLVTYQAISLFAYVIDKNWARDLALQASKERFPTGTSCRP